MASESVTSSIDVLIKKRSERPIHGQKKADALLLELPLVVTQGQAKRLRAHLEAGRQLSNAVLSQGQKRLRQMRADPAWQLARAIPRTHKQERAAASGHLRALYGFSEDALHEAATALRARWMAEHPDAVLAHVSESCVSRTQPCVTGQSPPRALSQSWQGSFQYREQAHQHQTPLRLAAARGRQARLSDLEG